MARLLPSRTDKSADQKTESSVERTAEPSVLYVGDERTEDIISTLSGDTAMNVFQMLNEEALTASEVAEQLDISVQNASYHLENLEDADLVEVVDTCYSEKGREMKIYAVTSEPKVLVLGAENEQGALRRAFGTMAGAIGVPAVLIAAWSAVSGLAESFLNH